MFQKLRMHLNCHKTAVFKIERIESSHSCLLHANREQFALLSTFTTIERNLVVRAKESDLNLFFYLFACFYRVIPFLLLKFSDFLS